MQFVCNISNIIIYNKCNNNYRKQTTTNTKKIHRKNYHHRHKQRKKKFIIFNKNQQIQIKLKNNKYNKIKLNGRTTIIKINKNFIYFIYNYKRKIFNY